MLCHTHTGLRMTLVLPKIVAAHGKKWGPSDEVLCIFRHGASQCRITKMILIFHYSYIGISMLKISFIITMTSSWARWRFKSPASRLFTQPFLQTQINENIKTRRHWPLWGEFTVDRWIPRTKGQWRRKCFHLMTSSWSFIPQYLVRYCSSVSVPSIVFIGQRYTDWT